MIYLFGASEPLGAGIIGEAGNKSERWVSELRARHAKDRKVLDRHQVSIEGFGIDHGLGAHSGNGGQWRTTVVAGVRLDYLKTKPLVYARMEGEQATELMSELAYAVAIRERSIR